jgi:hypothetical protein
LHEKPLSKESKEALDEALPSKPTGEEEAERKVA